MEETKDLLVTLSGLTLFKENYDEEIDNKLKDVAVPIASTTKAGAVKPDGTTITVDVDGTLHGATTYKLPTASNSVLGGVKVDNETITIDKNGVITLIY